MRTYLAAAAALILTTAAANAAPILSGNSNTSSFSNLTCTSCAQTSLSSTTLTLGTTASGGSNSLLSIVNTSFSANGTIAGLKLAELSLKVGNKPGVSQTNVGFDYSLVLSFSTPVGSTSQVFNLHASGDGGAGANADVFISGFSPLTLPDPLAMANVTLSNFRFATDALDSGSIFSAGTWDGKGPPNSVHSLFLLADVTDTTPVVAPVTAVPEPFTLGVFGAGLIGMGALRRRRKKTA